MAPSVLITQCLQNDFVQLIGPYDPLPNSLHVGYREAVRLLGHNVEEGPVLSVMDWAYGTRPDRLSLIHIRDWHDAADPAQQDHLRQFGAHCLRETHGARFVFEPEMRPDRPAAIVNASGLNDFFRTDLEEILKPLTSASAPRFGLMGVWTDAKISFLAYELRTRYPESEVAICSALCASSSRSTHFIALDQLENLLGVRVFSSVSEFTEFLTGEPLSVKRKAHSRLETSRLHFDNGGVLSDEDMGLVNYLFRESSEARFKVLDGGFSGNVVMKSRSRNNLGQEQVPSVVKIGPRVMIARERSSFERIEEVLGNSAPAVIDFAEAGERGAIKYRYAAMIEGDVTVFQDFYETSDDEKRIGEILDIVFRQQLGRLYEAAHNNSLNLLEYYDFRPKYAPGVRKRVEELLGAPADGETLSLPFGTKVPNVCRFYEKDLLELSEYGNPGRFQSYVHGDLNGRNIILDVQGNVWLIDFFHTHMGHILKDLIKLENDILFIFTKLEKEEDLKQAFLLTDALLGIGDLRAGFDRGVFAKISHPGILKAARTIEKLRGYYPDLIESDRDPYQLHVGLMRYAMHTLSFDESSRLQKIWALYSGSLCAEKIRNYLISSRRLRIDFLPLKNSPGRLGLTILPGRKDWGRDLNADMAELKQRKVTAAVCLITEKEFHEYGVDALPQAYREAGVEVLYSPVTDQGVPSVDQAEEVLQFMKEKISSGAALIVHCVGGVGRSGTMAALYLKKFESHDAQEAITLLRQIRSERAVENARQAEFVRNF